MKQASSCKTLSSRLGCAVIAPDRSRAISFTIYLEVRTGKGLHLLPTKKKSELSDVCSCCISRSRIKSGQMMFLGHFKNINPSRLGQYYLPAETSPPNLLGIHHLKESTKRYKTYPLCSINSKCC